MFILYTIILTLGLVTSYTDIRFEKIKNIHLLLAVIFGLTAYAYLIATQQIPFEMPYVWNILIGFGISLLLYCTETWGAGDAKLFIVYCLLMPTKKYSKIFFFPSIDIFANVFLVSTLGILTLSIKNIIRDRMRILKLVFSLSTLTKVGESFLIIFSIKWLIEIIINFFIPQAMFFMLISVMFFLHLIIRRIITKFKNKYIFALILSVGMVSRFLFFSLDFNIASFFSYLKMSACYTLLFHTLSVTFNLNRSDDKIPFAPIMLFGAVLINTNFMNWVMCILRALRK